MGKWPHVKFNLSSFKQDVFRIFDYTSGSEIIINQNLMSPK